MALSNRGNVTVGETIRIAREKRGLTLAALGEILHLNASTISRIENGLSSAKGPTLKAIAAELGLDAEDLIRETVRAELEPDKH